jgi:adenosylcobyric acid synthase
MNPILLKPTSDVGSQVVINGKVLGNYSGVDYYGLKPQLLEAVSSAYRRLAARYEVVVLEGAGSPVEMNLKDRDVVKMRMAEIADAACLLVTDIDRGAYSLRWLAPTLCLGRKSAVASAAFSSISFAAM